MKIHEYQAKSLLKKAGVAVPEGIVCKTADEVAAAFDTLGGAIAVVKSQIHAGGRGKGRFQEEPEQAGVVLVRSAQEARENAERMLGNTLVTIQTGDEGKQVNTLFVEQGLNIARELYLGIVVDREVGGPVLIMSSEGGMEIEEVAHNSPEKILTEPFDGIMERHQQAGGLGQPVLRAHVGRPRAMCRGRTARRGPMAAVGVVGCHLSGPLWLGASVRICCPIRLSRPGRSVKFNDPATDRRTLKHLGFPVSPLPSR